MKNKFLYIPLFIAVLLLLGVFWERNSLPETTSRMKERAQEYGEEQGKDTPVNPFTFDGCTLFPDRFLDSSFKEACLKHDIAYWYGGSKEERKEADLQLKEEVSEAGFSGAILQYPIYWGVRVFGDSFIARHFNAHWEFGNPK